MRVPIIAFFNNKGGVGKTSLVYHLSWMYAELGMRVVAADLDPQANLSAAFLDEERLEQLWEDRDVQTIFGSIEPLKRGVGDISEANLEQLSDNLALIVGDLSLSQFEDQLSESWPKCSDADERAFRVISAFWRIIQLSAERFEADVVLMDLGPNLGAINRAALIGADHVVIPLSPDIFSLQGLKNLGPTFRKWRDQWAERLTKNPNYELPLPAGCMSPVGYVVMQHAVRLDRPAVSYGKWIDRIPQVYYTSVLNKSLVSSGDAVDEHCLGLVKHYRSLMPMAQEVRKPIFFLRPADGAFGSHYYAVQEAYSDFKSLANKITQKASLEKR